jgi:DNA polymerase-3 subunit epsilon
MLGNDHVLWRSPPWDSLVYWSLDLETGGLDPRKDAILAVGMVPVRPPGIRLGEGYASLVRPDGGEGFHARSIQAHQLIPGELSLAPSLPSVLVDVDLRLREGALLVHQAALDVAFLKRAYARTGMRWPDPPVVDTVTLLIKAAKRARFVDPNASDHGPDLNLLAARRGLGLPDYGQHDALTDAIATAELFLVLRRQLGARTLRDLR